MISLQETFKYSTTSLQYQIKKYIPLLEDSWDSAAQNLPRSLHIGNIKYLGINISPRLSLFFNLNYTPLLKKIEDLLKWWNNLSLTLMGHIATVKMKILPQANFLFAMIPPTDHRFKTINFSLRMLDLGGGGTLHALFSWNKEFSSSAACIFSNGQDIMPVGYLITGRA